MVKSPFDDVEIPDVSVHDAIFQCMQLYADRVAVVDGVTEKQYTNGEVYQLIRQVASGLRKLGVKKGDILAIFSPNSPEYVFIFYAALANGATVTTINPAYTNYEVTHHLKDSGAKWIYTIDALQDIVLEAGKKYGNLKGTIVLGKARPGFIPMESLVADDGSMFPDDVQINPAEDVATVPYSSGTTGLPKGVMITHRNIMAQLVMMSEPSLQKPDTDSQKQDSSIVFLPFFHAYGMVGYLIGTFLRGNKMITMPRFMPERFLELIQKFRVTNLPLVPPVVIFLAKSPLVDKYDLSSVENVGSGAAPLSLEMEEEFKQRLKIKELRQGYGMTETTICVCYHPWDKLKPGACGQPLPNMEMQIVDPSTGKVLGVGERGEVWARGPNIMKGYLNNTEATRHTLDSDGWLHTGDIGYYDEELYFFIVDRMKELIKYKGFQVAPAELESLLLNHSQVADVGVIGVPDKEAGELPRAYVVKKPGATINEEDLKKYVAEHMATFKHLRGGVQFMSVIPKSPSGKILRRELRDMYTKAKL